MQHRHCSRLRVSGLIVCRFSVSVREFQAGGEANHPPLLLLPTIPCAILRFGKAFPMTVSSAFLLGVGLLLLAFSVRAQSLDAQSQSPNGLANLSAECRVPASELL